MFVIAQKILLNKKGTSNGRNVTFFSIRFQLDSYVLEINKTHTEPFAVDQQLQIINENKTEIKMKI